MASPISGLCLGYGAAHPFTTVRIEDRNSVQQLLKTLLDPLSPFFSPQKARLNCPGGTGVRFDHVASEIEGFCRPLWGLASLLAGGGKYHATDLWIRGIISGTDPASPEYWGLPGDNDQRMVEMCPLGFTLAVTPELWNKFTDKEKENIETWLGNSINEKKYRVPNTNWLWFRVFANLGLKKVGGKFSQDCLTSDIKQLDTFYRGHGWSNDGPDHTHQMDYYSSSFAIQLLQLVYAKLNETDDLEMAVEFKERARAVALDLMHYYDDEGRAIPFGRSMIYRFAVVSFWGALAYADVKLPAPLTWGIVKGIVLRNLRWWQKQNLMWTSSGTLSIGYSYPNMYMAESYNSPGSPYWACVAFICLAVPEQHPFWVSREEPIPASIPSIKAIEHPKHILSNLGGHHMLLSSGQACGYPMKGTHAKYGCFAYSSFFAYSVPPGIFKLEQYSLASQLGFSIDGGEMWKSRRICESARIEYRMEKPILVSTWKPFADVQVRTILLPPEESAPNWHLRIHHIQTSREVMTADGSFAVSSVNSVDGRGLGLYDPKKLEGTSPKVIGSYDTDSSVGWTNGSVGAFAVSKGAVGIRSLEFGVERRAMLVDAEPNSNLVESRTIIPTLQHTINENGNVWYITAIFAKPPAWGSGQENSMDGWDETPPVPDWLRLEMEERVQ